MAGAGGGAPPDYLGADDQRRVADVRRSVWTGGFQGLAFGLCFGSAGFLLGSRLGALPQPARAPKYWLLATMGLGALGSYVGALSAGRTWHSSLLERDTPSLQFPGQSIGESVVKFAPQILAPRRFPGGPSRGNRD